MITWRGYGLVVPLVAFASLLLGQWLVDSAFGAGYWKDHRWPLVTAALLGGSVLWALGRHLNRDRRSAWIDPASGLEFEREVAPHSFFFVPIEWTGPLLLLLASLIAFAIQPA